MDTMKALFEAGLGQIYFAEKAILALLPRMSDKAGSTALRVALDDHLRETELHIARLEQVFARLDRQPAALPCPAIGGLIAETEAMMAGARDPEVLDAALIGCAQAIEHFEMARYGTLMIWAERLDMNEIADILEDSLEEEETADDRFAELAVDALNEPGRIHTGTH